ncbi:VSK receptor [Vibrio intestinalis]|uniref:VSK receptor n=1 Tax=Vibrio intestinalis TaxID=2933291 RepID=UPI0021A375F9|nr:VSK receptor [Vibrio intestinalis]
MGWITDLVNKIMEFFYSLFLSLIDAIKDIVAYVFDQFLSVTNALVDGVIVSLSAIPMPETLPLPSGVSWVMSQIGVPQMLVMVSASLVVRLLLQLIPFVRLGS